jgi:hypothetical protein
MPRGISRSFIEHAGQPIRKAPDFRPEIVQARRNLLFRCAQPEGQRYQLLLSAIMEIAFDAPPRLVGGGDDAGAGGGEVGTHRRKLLLPL